MKFNNLVFIVFAISCLLSFSLSMRKGRKMRDVTNDNFNTGGTITNNNDQPGAAAINNNNQPAPSQAITNNNLPADQGSQVQPAADQASQLQPAAADNNIQNPQAQMYNAKEGVLEITGSAETMVDQDELNFLIRFGNDINNKFFQDLADMQKNIDDFKKNLIDLGIADDDFAVKENVDQFNLLRRYLKKLTENKDMKDEDKADDKADEADDKAKDAKIVNNNNNMDKANMRMDNNNMNDDMDFGINDFDLYAMFYVTVRDNKIAEQLSEAVGKFKGRIEDVSFSISEKRENEEKAKLMDKAINRAKEQANFIAQRQGFNIQNIKNIENEKYMLLGQVMTLSVDVKFQL